MDAEFYFSRECFWLWVRERFWNIGSGLLSKSMPVSLLHLLGRVRRHLFWCVNEAIFFSRVWWCLPLSWALAISNFFFRFNQLPWLLQSNTNFWNRFFSILLRKSPRLTGRLTLLDPDVISGRNSQSAELQCAKQSLFRPKFRLSLVLYPLYFARLWRRHRHRDKEKFWISSSTTGAEMNITGILINRTYSLTTYDRNLGKASCTPGLLWKFTPNMIRRAHHTLWESVPGTEFLRWIPPEFVWTHSRNHFPFSFVSHSPCEHRIIWE